ncbi:ethanolamine utilization protein EutN/carboxysome structural protein Ccml [Thermincola ferriacetica]|uniref:Ethanolamine utilization protein EutN/carboxysome structural protein Ccml n=2 Tax=Thermincola TaxID=278993 RepID=D5X8F8_THEPJ|nr:MULTISPECIES: EutN/CcmL family microcompartment protein [Thermincola]ADG80937.1 Ethanolamine utilization protein EutN/carboxysome structural protein Ccml [Thermincola potens JR]KNZ68764.1 ethanolamine utilization protein EutN/carboxysome structural protein Ccml [Thermincola ferriacetica]
MIIGKVVNSIWSTRKLDCLNGLKLMVVKTLDKPPGRYIVAADFVGAGIGERVLVTQGGSARRAHGLDNTPVDAIIVGIIDENQEEPLNGVVE